MGNEMFNKLSMTSFTALILLSAVCLSASGSLRAPRRLSIAVCQTTSDVTIVTKPQFRNVLKRNIELADQNGRLVAEQMYTYLDFKYGGKTYSAWWKSRTTPAPVGLFANIRYRFIVRLTVSNPRCAIIEIWEGKRLIWKNPKFE
jgi:hypothetical protein